MREAMVAIDSPLDCHECSSATMTDSWHIDRILWIALKILLVSSGDRASHIPTCTHGQFGQSPFIRTNPGITERGGGIANGIRDNHIEIVLKIRLTGIQM